MVTNLPAEAKAKWIKVMEARTIEEKIKALEEFLSAVPKHKGTENLREWATKRLAELREELEERKKKSARKGVSFFVEKEGAAQVVLIGLPNSGKSLIVHKLTGAKTRVSEAPFTTTFPQVGMLKFEDVYFQLIDTPPIVPGGGPFNGRVIGLCRNADLVMIVLDATRDIVSDYQALKKELESAGILLSKPSGRVEIERFKTGSGGIRVTMLGELVGATVDDVRKLLSSYNIYNAHVRIIGRVTLDDVEYAIFGNVQYKPSIILVNKIDIGDPGQVSRLRRIAGDARIISVSALTGEGLDSIGNAIFGELEIVRVYTKSPTGRVSDKPLVLKKGSTILDVAKRIHKDFVEKFGYARIWGPSAKYPGERVGLDHIVMDRDIVEIHLKE
ncbi:OBG GTPase family GTP-binding protein [Thermogladius sp. 4427co]|uniref:OBG GTPase family GTP-binding protein n=1 Tax=Thermogladius sp. 4427co TaxID=3450718 RepID=UPI003F7A2A55